MLLCYLCGALQASVNSPTDVPVASGAHDSSPASTRPPATVNPMALWKERIPQTSVHEFTLEAVSGGIIVLALETNLGSRTPELLSAVLIYVAALYVRKMGLTASRIELLRECASAPTSPTSSIRATQMVVSLVTVLTDAARIVTLFWIMYQGQYSTTDTGLMVATVFDALFVALLIGCAQITMSYASMAVWKNDTQDRVLAETKQD